MSQNTSLTTLECNSNSITALDVSQNLSLTYLYCQENAIVSLDLSNNPIVHLLANNNVLISLNLKNDNNINITYYNTTNNPNLTCIEVDDAAYSTTNWTNVDSQTSFSEDCEALPITYTYNGSWLPSDPNGMSSATDTIIIASGNAIISSNTSINTVTVNPGASLTLNTGITLTASEVSLESVSDSYSSLISDGTITGVVNYKRHVNQSSNGNDLISPPVSGQVFTDFISQNNNIVSNGSNTLFLFGPFDKTSGDYVTYSNTEIAQLTSGIGYRAATTDNGTLNFQGTVNQNIVMQSVLNSGPSFSKWNLIGNPYPSYLNVQDFLSNTNNLATFDPTNVSIYGYDGDASDGWVIYNLNTTDENTVLAPGQGFFVSVANNGTMNFAPSMRQHGSSDDFIAGRNANENQHLRLQLNTSNQTSNTDFYFNSNSSNGLDLGYDAAVFGDSAGSFAIYSHLVEENNGVDMAIQSLGLDFLSDGIIPLGINAAQGEQLTIAIETSNLPDTVEVYLEDTVENTYTILNTSNYVLTPATALEGTGRFYIHFSNSTLSTIETELNTLKVFTSKATKELIIKGQLFGKTKAQLNDINGREVVNLMLDASTNHNALDISAIQNGVYILQISDDIHNYTQKVLIN